MTSGGGSARLLSTYTVSPLEGITSAASEIGVHVEYAIGATSHKYLPLLDPYIQQDGGQPGALVEFWNESPSSDYVDVNPNFDDPLKKAIWSTTTLGTNCFLMDGIVSSTGIQSSQVNLKGLKIYLTG